MSLVASIATGATQNRKHSNRAWGKFRRNKAALFGAALVLAFCLLAILASLLTSFDPTHTSFSAVRKAPSSLHWLGTDELGRDVLSRIMFGARASLMAGLVSVMIALVLGVPCGLLAGYFGRWCDSVISRATEALLAIPFLILAIALASFLGPSLMNAMIAIGISAAPKFVRLTRGQVMSIKDDEYIQSARAIGASDWRIITRHILPNVMPPLIVQATITIASAIIAEASLSFLGLGLQPPNPSWGSMLNSAKSFMTQAPWLSLFPGAAIFLVVLGLNLLGDGLRDALDPRQDK